MGDTLVALLPFIIGSALVPLQIIIDILLLKSPQQGVLKAAGFVGGMTVGRLIQGLVFGLLLTGSTTAAEGAGGKSPLTSILLMLLGILLLIAAYMKWIKEDDPDAPPPKWLAALDSISPLKAFGLGLGLVAIAAKLWVFTLSAITVIAEAQLGQPTSAITYLLFILLAESLLILPILLRVILPGHSAALLDSTSAWLERNNRPITIGVSLVFGLLFLYQGVSGLL